MFTDEKVFTTNGYYNPKNDVVWADSRSQANEIGGVFEAEKYPTLVMVALGDTWNGLTEPYIFEKGERLNTESYDQVLMFYKRQGDKLLVNGDGTFNKMARHVTRAMKVKFFVKIPSIFFIDKNKWPPNSSDLNPLDYPIWAKISSNMDFKKVNSKESLVREIKKSLKNIDVDFLCEVIGSFLQRVYAVEKIMDN